MTPPQTLIASPAPARQIESVLENRWARLLMPSFSDLFFLAVLVWLFMSSGWAGWQGLLADGDSGWHIRTGQYILDHHSVPHHDLYSFSKPNAPWYAWEWGSDVIDALLYRLAGLKGVVLMAGVVIAAFATTLLRRMAWRGAQCFIGMVVALLGVGASSLHFLARPHIFTLLLLSISMWMIEADRKQPSQRIWWLVPLTIVWTNLHGGFLVLVAALGVTAVGSAVEAWLGDRDWNHSLRYAAVTAACAVSSLVNPYGYKLHVHVLEFMRSDWIRNMIQEFQSPSFRNENMMQFEALMLISLIMAAALFRRRQIVEGLWIVVFVHLSLSSVRHVPVFIAVAAPIIAAELTAWWNTWSAASRKNSLPGIINQISQDAQISFRRSSAWPVMVVFALAMIGAPIPWPQDYPELMFPTKMVHAHAAQILSSRVLTTDQWADYLIYTNPQQKVFVDGRSDFYGSEIGDRYIHVINGQPDWRKIMDSYAFNLVLVPVESAISQLLQQTPEWKIVDQDEKRILLVRKAVSVPSTGNMSPEPTF